MEFERGKMYTEKQLQVRKEWGRLAGRLRKEWGENGLNSKLIDKKLAGLNATLIKKVTGKTKGELKNACLENNPTFKKATLCGGLTDSEAEALIGVFRDFKVSSDERCFIDEQSIVERVGSNGLLLFIIIERFTNEDGIFNFDLDTFTSFSGMSKTTVRKYFKKLIKEKFVVNLENGSHKLLFYSQKQVAEKKETISPEEMILRKIDELEGNVFEQKIPSEVKVEKLRLLNIARRNMKLFKDV